MRTLYRCALLLLPLLPPSTLTAQQRGIEIGLDGGAQYAFDADLLAILIPFQRVRAAFPSGPRLAFEPALALARISSGGSSLLAVAFEVGALYDLAASRTSTYARPFAGIEYGDTSASDAETVFDLGIGFGTRSRLAAGSPCGLRPTSPVVSVRAAGRTACSARRSASRSSRGKRGGGKAGRRGSTKKVRGRRLV